MSKGETPGLKQGEVGVEGSMNETAVIHIFTSITVKLSNAFTALKFLMHVPLDVIKMIAVICFKPLLIILILL